VKDRAADREPLRPLELPPLPAAPDDVQQLDLFAEAA
jgi:hypothetical protein